ncbi:MAG: 3-deoxy-D-manno-octulosonic acid kinase [Lysobacterales bacterium]
MGVEYCDADPKRNPEVVVRPIQAQLWTEGDRVVIYDAARLPAPAASLFDPAAFSERDLLDRGRGATFAVRLPSGEAVLRRYRRGGVVSRWLQDRYLWTGHTRARPIREFRLLAEALAAGLPVPRPLAAEARRQGAYYTGSLLMARIADARTLSGVLADAPDWQVVDWQALGALLGRTHALGFQHADLNAHNVMIDGAGRHWLIDWDRGQRRTLDRHWPTQVLLRLQRSLRKLYAERASASDARLGWQQLLAAHDSVLGAAR